MSQDKSQRTEEATPHKLRKARDRGQIPKSKEVVSAASLIITLGVVLLASSWIAGEVMTLAGGLVDNAGTPLEENFRDVVNLTWQTVVAVSLPVLLATIAVGILAHVVQFGFLFSVDPVKPKLQRINPVEGTKRLFSRRKLIELLKSVVKLIVLPLVAVLVVRDHLQDLLRIHHCGLECGYTVAAVIVGKVFLALIPMFMVLAAIDYTFQRKEFMRDQRMTRQEVKREHKDTQGNPQLKKERKSRQREQIEEDVRRNASESTLLVTDGARLIGIRYDEEHAPVPRLTVRERGRRAMQARRIAEQNNRPILEDDATTGLLWKEVGRGDAIPRRHFDAVADLILRARQSRPR